MRTVNAAEPSLKHDAFAMSGNKKRIQILVQAPHGKISVYSSFESIVRLLHIKSELPSFFFAQFFCCPHLIQCDQPLDDLASVIKISICNLINRLDDFGQEWV